MGNFLNNVNLVKNKYIHISKRCLKRSKLRALKGNISHSTEISCHLPYESYNESSKALTFYLFLIVTSYNCTIVQQQLRHSHSKWDLVGDTAMTQ